MKNNQAVLYPDAIMVIWQWVWLKISNIDIGLEQNLKLTKGVLAGANLSGTGKLLLVNNCQSCWL